MWKKVANEPRVDNVVEPTIREENAKGQALVGPSITITGGLAGEEDVMIQGKVDGTIEFRQHNVTIGKHGRVKANIYAKEICVEGSLEGDCFGETRVSVRATGVVKGNIKAPRVVMEDGCKFKGSIEMEPGVSKESSDHNSNHSKTLSSLPPLAENLAADKRQAMTPGMQGNQKTVGKP